MLVNMHKRLSISGLRTIGIRCISNASGATEISTIKPTLPGKRIYFYALPLTTKKTFLHCKYNDTIFPDGKKTLENKIIDKFMTLWNNFCKSDAKFNQTIVKFINKILSNIPWLETCLLSIPSQKFITRKMKQDEFNKDKEQVFVTHEEILEKNIKSNELEMFDFYYPNKLSNMELIMNNFKPEFKSQYELHRKGILTDLLLMPLTIPFAIVPLLPNIPGFYLLYRIYCHIKVIASLKYLVILLKDGHFKFNKIDEIAEIYLNTKDEEVRANVINELAYVSEKQAFADIEGVDQGEREEKLLLSEDVAHELCKLFDDEKGADKLIYAIQQERKHLEERAKNQES
jgi:hypothetical protein